MKLGNLDYKQSESDPELSPKEKIVVNRLSVNYMKWSDPDEGVLEMVGLENAWAKEEKTDDPTLQGDANPEPESSINSPISIEIGIPSLTAPSKD
ncbi:unnamed protein product [Lactuca virosa]|uniref:Uncharacterized protein n=1 Tax=Lactuca virosa TaxID=75947 RepID=A0AAU9PVL6_9ASTR|nr:unnamed protein product [Lactuca virosa]